MPPLGIGAVVIPPAIGADEVGADSIGDGVVESTGAGDGGIVTLTSVGASVDGA